MGSFEKNYDVYKQLCEASDEKSQKLNELAQEKQNDFYGEWVGEMVRIAKVGNQIQERVVSCCTQALTHGFSLGSLERQ